VPFPSAALNAPETCQTVGLRSAHRCITTVAMVNRPAYDVESRLQTRGVTCSTNDANPACPLVLRRRTGHTREVLPQRRRRRLELARRRAPPASGRGVCGGQKCGAREEVEIAGGPDPVCLAVAGPGGPGAMHAARPLRSAGVTRPRCCSCRSVALRRRGAVRGTGRPRCGRGPVLEVVRPGVDRERDVVREGQWRTVPVRKADLGRVAAR